MGRWAGGQAPVAAEWRMCCEGNRTWMGTVPLSCGRLQCSTHVLQHVLRCTMPHSIPMMLLPCTNPDNPALPHTPCPQVCPVLHLPAHLGGRRGPRGQGGGFRVSLAAGWPCGECFRCPAMLASCRIQLPLHPCCPAPARHGKNLNSDPWRKLQLWKHTANPAHPFAR